MSGYKTDQRRLLHRGREFHFVSYEGLTANPQRGVVATPPTWYLMHAGKRWNVMPQEANLAVADLDNLLHAWLDANIRGVTSLAPTPDSTDRKKPVAHGKT